MAINANLAFQTYTFANGQRIGNETETLTGAVLVSPEFTIAAATTQSVQGIGFPAAALLGYELSSAQEPVTVAFQTTGSPVSISVAAGISQRWSPAHSSNPLATACNGLKVTNATTASSDISIQLLLST